MTFVLSSIRSQSVTCRLLCATALGLVTSNVLGQEVQKIGLGANTEPVALSPEAVGPSGFSITVNGEGLVSDPTVEQAARRADRRLADADVRVSVDGLGVEPRLDLEVSGSLYDGNGSTKRVILRSALNYPAFVIRADVRVIDLSTPGGPQTVLIREIAPNGEVTVEVPEGGELVVVHRVYDAAGRYDETAPLPLGYPRDQPRTEDVEAGTDRKVRQRIPVHGGAVTVSGTGVAPGASVRTLGEVVSADSAGNFVLQRILPPGAHGIEVQMHGTGQEAGLVREVEIPHSEWFTVGIVDLTLGRREIAGAGTSWNRGRLAFYTDGRIANGTRITASADTGEEEFEDLFRRFDEKDPQSLLDRLDPAELYPTYGDDSNLEDRTPSSGTVFLRIEQDGNYLQYGDFSARLSGNSLVQNERSLYGLEAYWATESQTSFGEPRGQALTYAAQPDQLPQRDTFLGTGGSVYFLERQAITPSTEILSVQLRDPDTGRIVETRYLAAGEDYSINYVQGIVTLDGPLQSSTVRRLGGGDALDVVLVAQYEYTPTAGDLDGYAYGGRVEGWATDQLRLGLSTMVEKTGAADQTVRGADLLWRHSEGTHVRLEYAESEGPGFGSAFSADGGLIFDSVEAAAGTGEAVKAEVRIGFADLGLTDEGYAEAYYEDRTEGFSSLDTQVTATTGDEELYGIALYFQPNEYLSYALSFDSYQNGAGDTDRLGTAEIALRLSDRVELAFGVAHAETRDEDEDGTRTDISAQLAHAVSDVAEVYLFGRRTVDDNGLGDDDRLGIGARYDLANGWTLGGEISDGTEGPGGRVLASYGDAIGNTHYIGWELDPGREIGGVTLAGRDQGRLVMGGRRVVNDRTTYFGENTYDLFGDYRALTSAYGVTFAPTETLSTSVAVEYGQVTDRADNDFDRQALSLGARYGADQLKVGGRLEIRRDEGIRSGEPLETDTFLVSADLAYKIDDAQRIVLTADHARTETDESDILDGRYSEMVLGYAIRPVTNDRLNLLARYRFLEDLVGQRIDGNDESRIRQRSHVASLDASYDLDERWTIGGKLGYRSADTAASEDSPFVGNDAWLAIANARYHMTFKWDALIEVRTLNALQGETSETGILAAMYRHLGSNTMLGAGYNFGTFSDDLTDLGRDERGTFVNLVAAF